MPKKIQLEPHKKREELETGYREARDAVERSHYQIIWLISSGKTTSEVMEVTGYSRNWIQQLSRRYNEQGEKGLGDQRHQNQGAEGILSPKLKEELGKALQSPPEDGGMWNSRKVAEWIEEHTGRQIWVQRGWEQLRQQRQTPQVPYPTHAKANPEEQAEFRKNSPSG